MKRDCRTAELRNCGIAAMVLALLCTPAGAQKNAAAKPAKAAMAKTETAGGPVALKGGKLLTITHGTIENGVVVMENGKITAVGPASFTSIPANARVIDATGMTSIPG